MRSRSRTQYGGEIPKIGLTGRAHGSVALGGLVYFLRGEIHPVARATGAGPPTHSTPAALRHARRTVVAISEGNGEARQARRMASSGREGTGASGQTGWKRGRSARLAL